MESVSWILAVGLMIVRIWVCEALCVLDQEEWVKRLFLSIEGLWLGCFWLLRGRVCGIVLESEGAIN